MAILSSNPEDFQIVSLKYSLLNNTNIKLYYIPADVSLEILENIESLEPCIKDAMTPTNSPRPLFPFVELKQELVITERRLCNPLADRGPANGQRKVYMFSRLLRELDEMCEQQIPYIEALLEEISENLEEEEEKQEEEEIEPEQEYMGISFMRSNEYSFSLGRKEEVVETPQPTENSESESEPEDNMEGNSK